MLTLAGLMVAENLNMNRNSATEENELTDERSVAVVDVPVVKLFVYGMGSAECAYSQ